MNKWLKIFLIISIFCIFITRYFWVNTSEFWEYGYETGAILTDLSIGFIAAFIFYIMDIWLPNKNKRENINSRLAIPLSRMLNSMKTPIEHTVNRYLDEKINISDISTTQLASSIVKVDLINDNGPVFFLDKNRNANYLEYLMSNVDGVNNYCKQVYEFPAEIDVDLVSILDRIRNSIYHESIDQLRKFWVEGSGIDKEFFSKSFPIYLEMYKELHNYMERNKIKVTIENL